MATLFLLLGSTTIGYYWQSTHTGEATAEVSVKPVAPPNWILEVKTTGEKPLPSEVRQKLLAALRRGLDSRFKLLQGDGSPLRPLSWQIPLETIAQDLQKKTAFGRVHLLRVGPRRFTVHVEPRVSAACIVMDKTRFVTNYGQIYGVWDAGLPVDTCGGPLIEGIFTSSVKPSFKTDSTIELLEADKKKVDAALELAHILKSAGLAAIKIFHTPYRGYGALLRSDRGGGRGVALQTEDDGSSPGVVSPDSDHPTGTEVALGQPPFEKAVGKLQRVLRRLSRHDRFVERIELDYQGKAFIKYENM